jgi:hypothetical protein
MAAIVRASHAVSFNLLNSDGLSVIGIFNEDTIPLPLTLEIINSSRRNLRLKNLGATAASAAKHHFELKFRPGTLNPRTLNQITIDEGPAKWKISAPVQSQTAGDEYVSFYLLSTNPGVLASGSITSLKLNKVNADATGGARGTKVELKWKGDTLEYDADATAPKEDLVAGQRVKHVDVVNYRGEKEIPLHVGFAGTNQVLNDGTPNTLTLRLTNTNPVAGIMSLIPPGDRFFPPTQFTLSFENSNKEWTLGPVAEINMESVPKEDFDVRPDAQASPPVWRITPKRSIPLAPGGFVDIKIKNIKTNNQAGPTNLYFHYKNIPGYWDGNFVSVIEKAPVVYKEKNVGVGTNDPKEKLHVAGKLQVDGKTRFDDEVLAKALKLDQGSKIHFAKGGEIWSIDKGHRIMFQQAPDVLEFRERGQIVFSPGSDGDEMTAFVTMKTDGRVGIGVNEPSTHLHVKGDGDQEISIESTETGGVRWTLQSAKAAGRFEIVNRTDGRNCFTILKDGKVGIGTVEPKRAMLDITTSVKTLADQGYFYMNDTKTAREDRKTLEEYYSVWASYRIAASEFNAVSDGRIKNVQGRSDSARDLSILLGIEITDYTYKDVIGKGAGAFKKVIGQQIEKVFPQAVSRATDVVPDIYQQASIQDGWVSLATDLKKGDRVKLITEQGEDVHEVLEVTDDKFRVVFEHEDDKVFVFGREVNDFLTVDYDAIAMLNVSATQQLKKDMDREIKALRVENAELRAANGALMKRLQLLESKIEAALGVKVAANGSNGNGRH